MALAIGPRPLHSIRHYNALTRVVHFHSTHPALLPSNGPKPLPPRTPLPEDSFTEAFLKGTGPGGQKINKTSCAVQLIHHASGIVVKCQETRSRSQNRTIARRWLQDRLEVLELGDAARTNVKKERERKKKASRAKKSRRKYRALAGKEEAGEDGNEGLEEGEDGDEGGVDGEEEHPKKDVQDERVESHIVRGGGDAEKQKDNAGTTAQPSTSARHS